MVYAGPVVLNLSLSCRGSKARLGRVYFVFTPVIVGGTVSHRLLVGGLPLILATWVSP